MSRYVWMFLVRTEALPGHANLLAGSEAQLQVCIPGEQIEPSLEHLSRYLVQEHCRRLDVSIARRFDLDDKTEEFPAGYLERELRKVGASNVPATACTFTSRDSASWQQETN